MITKEESKELLRMRDTLKSLRSPYEKRWKMIAKWIDPLFYGSQEMDSPPDTNGLVDTNLCDTTISYYSQVFATGLQGYTCSSQSAFFELQPEEMEKWKEEDRELLVRILQSRARKMYKQLASSGFYSKLYGFFKSFGDLGTAIMFFGKTTDGKIYFEHIPTYQCLTMHNRITGIVDTLFRTIYLTKYEIMQTYNLTEEELPQEMRKKTSDDALKQWKVIQLFCPRDRFEMSLSHGFKYAHIVWVAEAADLPIYEGGSDFLPFCVCSFGRSTDGTGLGVASPGMRQVKSSKALQKLLLDQLEAADLLASPPIKKTENVNADISPGAFITIPAGGDIAPMQLGSDLSWTTACSQKLAILAKADYYVDFFLMLSQYSGQVNTATLAQGLQNEQIKMMTFFLDVLKADFFEPIIDWLYNAMGSEGMFDDGYDIDYKNLQVDYVSPLFRIQQQAVTIEPTSNAMQLVLPYIQIAPELVAYIDFHAYASAVAEATGADMRIIRTKAEAEEIISAQQRAQQEAQQRQMDIQQQEADTKTMLAAKTAAEPGSEAQQSTNPYSGMTLGGNR